MEVMRQLRAIRDATFEDVADAMASRIIELKLGLYTNAVRPMSADEIQRLEETGRCEATHDTLYLLAQVLGVSVGYAPWLVDLIDPGANILSDPQLRALDIQAENLAIQQRYSFTRMGLTEQIPYSQKQLEHLYERTGFIPDTESSLPILKRFLRQPFSETRYKIFVVSLRDGGLFPFHSPGSLLLVDTYETLSVQFQPNMAHPYYICSMEDGHRCGWPILKEGSLVLQTVGRDGTWHLLKEATSLGVPCSAYWSLNPLDGHDFWLDDHRDQWTLSYVRSLRRKFPPTTIQ